jgi:hypothetical protein
MVGGCDLVRLRGSLVKNFQTFRRRAYIAAPSDGHEALPDGEVNQFGTSTRGAAEVLISLIRGGSARHAGAVLKRKVAWFQVQRIGL